MSFVFSKDGDGLLCFLVILSFEDFMVSGRLGIYSSK